MGLPDGLFTAPANAMTAIWLGANLVLPLWLVRFYPTPVPGAGERSKVEVEHPFFSRIPLSTLDLASLIAVGFVLLVAADWMGTLVPSVLWLTTFALIVDHVGPFRSAPGAMQFGVLALHFFFVIIGNLFTNRHDSSGGSRRLLLYGGGRGRTWCRRVPYGPTSGNGHRYREWGIVDGGRRTL